MPGRSSRNRASSSDALAATELVLTREQHLSQLDGLAAAAAHELGTPFSTIAVVAQGTGAAIEPSSPPRRRRPSVARAGAALPRYSRQAHRAARAGRAVRAHEALGPDRGGRRAASQFRRRHRGRNPAEETGPSRSGRAIPRSSMVSATCWKMPSTSPATRSRSLAAWNADKRQPRPSATTVRAFRPRSWTA